MSRESWIPSDPHAGQRVEALGSPADRAVGAVVMVHGRGASPEDILGVAQAIGDSRFTYLAPAAAGSTWYPYGFLSPTERNEPGLSSALGVIDGLIEWLDEQGIGPERVVLLGFSQGACLSSEYAVRNARRYGGLVAFSGGLIGPPGTVWENPGDFAGTPVFLGCSDVDPHIPLERVNESELVFGRMGAEVTKRIYPGMGHLVNDDEIAFARSLLAKIAG